jgi:hypothetical protein
MDKTCENCRFREFGTCCCINWQSPNKDQFVPKDGTCEKWEGKKNEIPA